MNKKNLLLQLFVGFSFSFIFMILLVYVVVGYIQLPIVYEDVKTGKCSQVLLYDGRFGDCNNLPEKYIHEYSSDEK